MRTLSSSSQNGINRQDGKIHRQTHQYDLGWWRKAAFRMRWTWLCVVMVKQLTPPALMPARPEQSLAFVIFSRGRSCSPVTSGTWHHSARLSESSTTMSQRGDQKGSWCVVYFVQCSMALSCDPAVLIFFGHQVAFEFWPNIGSGASALCLASYSDPQ